MRSFYPIVYALLSMFAAPAVVWVTRFIYLRARSAYRAHQRRIARRVLALYAAPRTGRDSSLDWAKRLEQQSRRR